MTDHPDAPAAYSSRRYLRAKETVDDRALHRPTLDRLAAELSGPVEVFEVGPGVGSMLVRLLAWDCLPDAVRYTGVDANSAHVTAARRRVRAWARRAGYAVSGASTLRLTRGTETAVVRFETGDALARLARADRSWDLLVGCAVLDLFDLAPALETLLGAVAPGGLAYFPVTFDGETVFRPVPDEDRERRVVDAYHGHMDGPTRPGGSRTGRSLFSAVPAAGGEVLSAGGSDWVVTPPYPADEAYFLHHLIHTVEGAVRETGAEVPVEAWARDRHAAASAESLTYLTHQVDLLARVG